jgi:capsular polysaccharide biosynthesis protein
MLIVITSFLVSVVVAVWSSIAIKGEFVAKTTLIRYSKNITRNSPIPYLYQDLSLNTIMQYVRMRENLEEIINRLNLQVTPQQLFGAISVERGSRSDILVISAAHSSRDVAVDIANTTAEVFIENYNQILNSATKDIYDYYVNQRKELLQQLEKDQQVIEAFQKKNNLVSIEAEISRKQDLLKQLELDRLNTKRQIDANKSILGDLNERLNNLEDDIIPVGYTIKNTIESQIKKKKNELSMLLEQYTPEHPKVKQLQAEIEILQQKLEEAKTNRKNKDFVADEISYAKDPTRQQLQLDKNKYEYELRAYSQNLKQFDQQIEDIQKELEYLSRKQKEFYQLNRAEELTKNQLDMTENRIMDIKMAMESNVSDFEVLEYAIPPEDTVGTGRKVIVLSAGIITFFGLLFFFLIRALLDNTVKSEYDFKEILDIKLLGEIPNKEEADPLYYHSQMQLVFGQFMNSLPSKKPQIVSFGNDKAETGKTYLIKEFIELLTSQGKRVLWIESIFEKDEEISDFIINKPLYNGEKIDKHNINMITEKLHKSYFLCDDDIFRKVLDKQEIKIFLSQLSEYDVIIWELFEVHYYMQLFTTIASCTDLLVFVARFADSGRDGLSNAIEFLKENSTVPLAGILNDVEEAYAKVKY